MLVLSRHPGKSIMVKGPEGACLITVLQVRGAQVLLLISHSPTNGDFDSWTATLVRDATVQVGATARVTLVDVRDEKARLGINASKESLLHRLEVWQAIKRENRRDSGGDPEAGPSGSPVPRPGGPTPPSLDVHLKEPPAADGNDGMGKK